MIHIEKRQVLPKGHSILVSVLSIVFALLLMGLILLIFGADPAKAYQELFTWPFLPAMGLEDTIVKMIPLLIISLGLAITFKMKIWNIGAEGQFFMGGMFTTFGALYVFGADQSPWVVIPLLLVFGFLGGAFWASIVAFLKTFLKIDEILVTLMLNYVAMYWVDHLIYGPWKDPRGFNFPLTAVFPINSRIPRIGGTSIHGGLLVALALVIVVYLLMKRSRWGHELEIIGDNPVAGRYAGFSVRKNIFLTLIISGGLAGLAGSVQLLGVQHRLQRGFSMGYGFTAIIVAWLSKLNPWAMALTSFLFAGLIIGSEQLQIVMRLPVAMVNVLQGLVLLCLLITETLFRYRIRWVSKKTHFDPLEKGED